jgi:TH1 protein/WW domain
MTEPTTTTAATISQEPQPQAQLSHDWSAFYDDEGRLYYYNAVTEESSWDAPPDGLFNPPDDEEVGVAAQEDAVTDEPLEVMAPTQQQGNDPDDNETGTIKLRAKDALHDSSNSSDVKDDDGDDDENMEDHPNKKLRTVNDDGVDGDDTRSSQNTAAATELSLITTTTDTTATIAYDWSAYYDEEGRIYYYNSSTDESVWEPPAEGFHPPTTNDDDANLNDEDNHDTDDKNDKNNLAEVNETNIAVAENNDPDAMMDDIPVKESDIVSRNGEDKMDESHNSTAINATTTPWIAYDDDEGREYYYNTVTGETQWDVPKESYRRADDIDNEESQHDDDPVVTNVDVDGIDQQHDAMDVDEPLTSSNNDKSILAVTTDVQKQDDGTEKGTIDTSAIGGDEMDTNEAVVVPVQEVVDPSVQRLLDAEAAIHSPDSVLEPRCLQHVSEIVQADDGNATRAISALIDHYHGQTAVCGLVSRWYLDLCQNTNYHPTPALTSSATKDRIEKQSILTAGNNNTNNADHLRNVIQNVICKVAKEKYTKEDGDSILDLSKSEVVFLEEMMESTRWRTLLIDLSASHKDSAVLLYCLRAISKRGHHREIVQRINPSEHFTVFHAMLRSELTTIGRLAVSAQSDIVTATTFQDLIQNILKSCTATSYTYLYSIHMIEKLIQISKLELATTSKSRSDSQTSETEASHNIRFQRAILKWETLLQLLESSMVDPQTLIQSESGSSPLLRRRKLEIALTISDLYQRQRAHKRQCIKNAATNMTVDNDHDVDNNETNHRDRLDTALMTLLKRHAMGIQIDDSVLNKLLPIGLDVDTHGVGELLIQYPIAVRALIGHLYKPGPTRITSPSTKNKCARLITLCMLAAEKVVKGDNAIGKGFTNATMNEADDDDCDGQQANEVTITQQILQGSLYCEQLETMISFLVTTNDVDLAETRRKKSLLTVGEKLCSLALSVAPIGLGVAMWAREFTQGREFAVSASYATLSYSILSLVRIVALRHPFARPEALQVGLAFLRHTNSDVSYQKVNSIKECGLRLLIFLLLQGDVVAVLSSLTQRVQQNGSSELDASLIRYFVGGVLDVVQPPVSPMFIRMFGLFLISPNVIDAVRSTYFAESNRTRLLALVNAFYESNPVRSRTETAQDEEMRSLVSTLISTYR